MSPNFKKNLWFLVCFSIYSTIFSQESKIIPYPKKVSFGNERFIMKDAAIVLSDKVTNEDIFAFQQFHSFVKEQTGIDLPIVQSVSKNKFKPIYVLSVGDMSPLPTIHEAAGPDSREAFHISVDANEIKIKANSSAGIYYAFQTLRQLIHSDASSWYIKEMELDDYPSIAYRALMMDFAHGGLLKVDEIKKQIDFLARFKTNQYLFYNEISIQLDGYENLNYKACYSKEQIKEIIEYARQRHIDVIPNTNLYGHLHECLRNEKYKSLGIGNYGHELDPKNPKVNALLKDWIEQYAKLFPSPFFHIGFDEIWETKRISSFKRLNLDTEQLFLDQLSFISEEFKKYNKTVMSWSDMTNFYPDIISKFPKDVIPVVWQYYGDADYFYKFLNPVLKYNKTFMVQPAVTGWAHIYPLSIYSFSNMDLWLQIGIENKTIGYVTSIWTDMAEPFIRPSWMFASYGSVIAWQGKPIVSKKYKDAYVDYIFPEKSDEMKKVFQLLDSSAWHLEQSLSNHNPGSISEKWVNPFMPFYLENTKIHQEDFSTVRRLCEEVQDILIPLLSTNSKDSIYLNSLLVSAKLIHYAASRFIYARSIVDRWNEAVIEKKNTDYLMYDLAYFCHSLLRDAMDENGELEKEYQQQWHNENLPYRLNTILTFYEVEAEFWRKLYLKVQNFEAMSRKENAGMPTKSFEELFVPEY